MNKPIDTMVWNLHFELGQFDAATHYYSSLMPSPRTYREAWQAFSNYHSELDKQVRQLRHALAEMGVISAELAEDPCTDPDELPF